MVVRIIFIFFSLLLLFSPQIWAAPTVSQLKKHLSKHPDDWRRRRELANLLLKAKNHLQAEKELERILDLRPHAHNLRCKLGVLKWRRGEKEAAIEQWRKVLAYQPGNKKAISYLKKVKADVVAKYKLALQWPQKHEVASFSLEMGHQEEAEQNGKNILKASSTLTGKMNFWALSQKNDKTKVAIQTIVKKGKMPKGMFLPQPAVFGFPRTKTIQTRTMDKRGIIHTVGGVEERDVSLYRLPYFVLPQEPVSQGSTWSYETTSPVFYFHANLGTVKTSWTYELAEIMKVKGQKTVVIRGKAKHSFLASPKIGKALQVEDAIEVGLDLNSGQLMSYVHNVAQINKDPRTSVVLNIVDGIGLKRISAPQKAPPKVEQHLLTTAPKPRSSKPQEKEVRKFLEEFFEYLYYGHADKLTLNCIDFHNLKDVGGDHGMLYRNTSKDYRHFLVRRTLKNIQRLAANVDTGSASPHEIASLVKERSEMFKVSSYGPYIRATDGKVTFYLHIIKGKTRIVRIYNRKRSS